MNRTSFTVRLQGTSKELHYIPVYKEKLFALNFYDFNLFIYIQFLCISLSCTTRQLLLNVVFIKFAGTQMNFIIEESEQ